MDAVSSIARSGMTAALQQQDSAAHNIANSQTPHFKRENVSHRELANGGVATTTERTETVGNNVSADSEMVAFAKNSLDNQLLTEALSAKYRLVRAALG